MSRAFRLGVFIVATLSIFAAGVFLIGDRQLLFASAYELKSTFRHVSGLVEGADVRVGGIHQGTVEHIDLPERPGESIVVVMKLRRATMPLVRTDSVASIQSEGLLGSKYVQISFGTESAPAIQNGGTIQSEPPLDMADLMNKTNEILDNTNETMKNVQASSDNFKEISDKIERGVGTVGALVNDRKMYDTMNQTAAQAQRGAAAFQENMEALKHNFFLRGFFKNRGYDDATKIAEYEIARLPQATPVKSFRYDAAKIFDDSDTAKNKNGKVLNEAGRFLQDNPFGAAVVIAAGGMKGDSAEIQMLTRARAMVAREYLAENFKMDDSRVKTMGVGKSESAGDGGAIQIVVYPPGARIQTAARPPNKK
jgi:phospholipid/cholesterol/gamma-HCH transport system substrate-binding protein